MQKNITQIFYPLEILSQTEIIPILWALPMLSVKCNSIFLSFISINYKKVGKACISGLLMRRINIWTQKNYPLTQFFYPLERHIVQPPVQPREKDRGRREIICRDKSGNQRMNRNVKSPKNRERNKGCITFNQGVAGSSPAWLTNSDIQAFLGVADSKKIRQSAPDTLQV